jgi:hypothetical protein
MVVKLCFRYIKIKSYFLFSVAGVGSQFQANELFEVYYLVAGPRDELFVPFTTIALYAHSVAKSH